MRRWLSFLILAATPLVAAIRLYLTDGTYHLVREYQVLQDRVRFYSVERSEWEEIPLDLVDLKRTEAEIRARQEEQKKELEWFQAEEEAERARQREIARIPVNPGVYWVEGEEVRSLPQADLKGATDVKRTLLKLVTPAPIVPGKRLVLIEGANAETRIDNPTPRFYLRLAEQERFALVRAKPRDNARLVQVWQIVPGTNELFEEHDEVETFRQQVGWNLYLLWPKQPLEPGEYAVIEYAPGQGNLQAWDFGYWPQGVMSKEKTPSQGKAGEAQPKSLRKRGK